MKGFKDLEQYKDETLGRTGTPERDRYEFDLQLDILGYMIRQTRTERKLTQAQLGDLLGVQKAEISKLERNARNMTIGTALKVFRALGANIKFSIILDDDAQGLRLSS
jgi:HTH-type transcriptional regulator/antitoxin HipB